MKLDRLYAHDLGNLLFQHSLNAIGEGELRHGTAAASADQLDLDDSVIADLNKLNIAAVRLKCGTDLVQRLLYALLVHARTPS